MFYNSHDQDLVAQLHPIDKTRGQWRSATNGKDVIVAFNDSAPTLFLSNVAGAKPTEGIPEIEVQIKFLQP
jgi:hypothetical protein